MISPEAVNLQPSSSGIQNPMRIDIWSDIVCPFCLIGRKELANALATFQHRDEVQVASRAFELDPGLTGSQGLAIDHLQQKYGLSRADAEASNERIAERASALGLTFNWRAAQHAATFDAHRVIKLAASLGAGPRVEAALSAAYFTHGLDVSDHAVLVSVAAAAGLDAERVATVLLGTEFADAVRADEDAARALGVRGVPFFLVDGTYAIQGAQTAATFGQALDEIWSRTHAASEQA